jgi:CHASE1-domain containing sensor protein
MKQMLDGEHSPSGIDPATLGRTLKGISWRTYVSGATVFAVGAALTVATYLMLRERTRAAQRAEFEQVATQLTSSFRTRLELPLEVLHSIESLFLSSTESTVAGS